MGRAGDVLEWSGGFWILSGLTPWGFSAPVRCAPAYLPGAIFRSSGVGLAWSEQAVGSRLAFCWQALDLDADHAERSIWRAARTEFGPTSVVTARYTRGPVCSNAAAGDACLVGQPKWLTVGGGASPTHRFPTYPGPGTLSPSQNTLRLPGLIRCSSRVSSGFIETESCHGSG